MSYQWVVNNAESIGVDKRKVTAISQSRSGVVRSVSRGGQVWRFEVTLPNGMKWSDVRQNVADLDTYDRTQSTYINVGASGLEWIFGYQGDSANTTGFTASIVQGSNQFTLVNSPSTPTGGKKFRKGDIVQFGTGKVYQIVEDVPFDSNIVTVHRPVLDANATVNLIVGSNVNWYVLCTELPTWNLFARDQVAWSGPFIFTEVLL